MEQDTRLKDMLQKERVDWRERVDTEHTELKGRVQRLESFMQSTEFYKVHDNEKGLLDSQLGAIKNYLKVLGQRMEVHKGIG